MNRPNCLVRRLYGMKPMLPPWLAALASCCDVGWRVPFGVRAWGVVVLLASASPASCDVLLLPTPSLVSCGMLRLRLPSPAATATSGSGSGGRTWGYGWLLLVPRPLPGCTCTGTSITHCSTPSRPATGLYVSNSPTSDGRTGPGTTK
jgi:hypothetical protein